MINLQRYSSLLCLLFCFLVFCFISHVEGAFDNWQIPSITDKYHVLNNNYFSFETNSWRQRIGIPNYMVSFGGDPFYTRHYIGNTQFNIKNSVFSLDWGGFSAKNTSIWQNYSTSSFF